MVSIEAVNEPVMDAASTPDYGTCKLILECWRLLNPFTVQKHSVEVVRAVEHSKRIQTAHSTLDNHEINEKLKTRVDGDCVGKIMRQTNQTWQRQ